MQNLIFKLKFFLSVNFDLPEIGTTHSAPRTWSVCRTLLLLYPSQRCCCNLHRCCLRDFARKLVICDGHWDGKTSNREPYGETEKKKDRERDLLAIANSKFSPGPSFPVNKLYIRQTPVSKSSVTIFNFLSSHLNFDFCKTFKFFFENLFKSNLHFNNGNFNQDLPSSRGRAQHPSSIRQPPW